MENWAKLIEAAAAAFWPLLAALTLFSFRRQFLQLLDSGAELAFEFVGTKVAIKPTTVDRTPEIAPSRDENPAKIGIGDPIPADYVFLNHTSFLREKEQKELQEKAGAPLPTYQIRVITDSYYEGALDRISHVEYILHQAYPEPRQIRSQIKDKFLLKELANGEYVLLAKVYFKDRKVPLILQRYITLWKEGPRLP